MIGKKKFLFIMNLGTQEYWFIYKEEFEQLNMGRGGNSQYFKRLKIFFRFIFFLIQVVSNINSLFYQACFDSQVRIGEIERWVMIN